jgi:hypothetical protein
MASKMTHTIRAELANAVRRRYRAATGKQKRRILDEFIATTGYHEKSAIRVLNAAPIVTARQTRNRPSLYDEAARAALLCCGKPRIEFAVNACERCCRSCCRLWSDKGTCAWTSRSAPRYWR